MRRLKIALVIVGALLPCGCRCWDCAPYSQPAYAPTYNQPCVPCTPCTPTNYYAQPTAGCVPATPCVQPVTSVPASTRPTLPAR